LAPARVTGTLLRMVTILIAVGSFAAGAVFSYLFLRANRNKKAVVDQFTDKVSDRISR
jgi:uncharacterized membrane protein